LRYAEFRIFKGRVVDSSEIEVREKCCVASIMIMISNTIILKINDFRSQILFFFHKFKPVCFKVHSILFINSCEGFSDLKFTVSKCLLITTQFPNSYLSATGIKHILFIRVENEVWAPINQCIRLCCIIR